MSQHGKERNGLVLVAEALHEVATGLANLGNSATKQDLAETEQRINDAISKVGASNSNQTILDRIAETERKIMSAISDFAVKQDAFNDRQDAAITGLQGDVQALKDEITKLQNSPGTITPEDQATLDRIQARSETIATKLEALDALTPPTPPTT
jgi:predicted  nucleic acid-binding Zn-ribbon protein